MKWSRHLATEPLSFFRELWHPPWSQFQLLVGSVMSHALKFQHFGCGLYHQVIMLRLLTYWHLYLVGLVVPQTTSSLFDERHGIHLRCSHLSTWFARWALPRCSLAAFKRSSWDIWEYSWCSAAIGWWNIWIDRAPLLECMCSSNTRMDAGQKTISWLPRQQWLVVNQHTQPQIRNSAWVEQACSHGWTCSYQLPSTTINLHHIPSK